MTALSWCTIKAVLKDQNSKVVMTCTHSSYKSTSSPLPVVGMCWNNTNFSENITRKPNFMSTHIWYRICHYIGSHRSLCCIQAAPEQHCLISVPTSTAPPFLPTHWDPPALFCIVNDSCHQWAPKGPLLVESYAANPHTLMFLLLEAISP